MSTPEPEPSAITKLAPLEVLDTEEVAIVQCPALQPM
jgi:hypothetical protein